MNEKNIIFNEKQIRTTSFKLRRGQATPLNTDAGPFAVIRTGSGDAARSSRNSALPLCSSF